MCVSAELNLSELKVHFDNQLINFAPQLHIMDLTPKDKINETIRKFMPSL